MKLEVLTPEKILYKGEAEKINLPGKEGTFSVLDNHIPMISILKLGTIIINTSEDEKMIDIVDGVIEVKSNEVIICVNE